MMETIEYWEKQKNDCLNRRGSETWSYHFSLAKFLPIWEKQKTKHLKLANSEKNKLLRG